MGPRGVADALERPGDHDHVHRPLAGVRVGADLDRHREDLAVEAVDLPVLADEVLGHRGVARDERGLGLHGLRARRPAHPHRAVEQVLVHRRVVAGQRDELGDVHALVAHPLHVLDDVQERRDEPQVARDGRLQGEQRQHPLVDL
jgi:hypothetical protein